MAVLQKPGFGTIAGGGQSHESGCLIPEIVAGGVDPGELFRIRIRCAEGMSMNRSDATILSDLNMAICSSGVSVRKAWILRSLCATGLAISSYLAWTALQMKPVYGCGSGEIVDCSHVLNSRWSKVAGLPVSIPAAGLYASLLGMLFFVNCRAPEVFHRWLWKGLTAGFVSAGIAALWFIGLQIFALQHICPYCIAVHTCGLILAGIALASRHISLSIIREASGIGVAAAAVLIFSQVLKEEEPKFEIVIPDYAKPADLSAAGEEFGAPAEGAGEDFSAPGEEFAAPGGDDSAPGESFDAPVTGDSEGMEQSDVLKPEISAALLLLSPFRVSLFQSALVVAGCDELSNPASVAPVESGSIVDPAVPQGSSTPATAAQDTVTGTATGTVPENAATVPVTEGQKPDAGDVSKDVAKVASRKVTVAGTQGPITMDVRAWPLLGSSDARYVFVEMFDYTCPHCRETHKAIRGAMEQFGNDVAVIALPVPLERSCNKAATGSGHAGACELGRIAVAVWRCEPGKFREFHDWMFAGNRTTASARAYAEQLVGAEKLKKELASGVPAKYIARHVDLYVKVGSGSVPKMMFSTSAVNGQVQKDWLCSMISREMEKTQPK